MKKKEELTPEEQVALNGQILQENITISAGFTVVNKVIDELVHLGGTFLYMQYIEAIKPEFELNMIEQTLYVASQAANPHPDLGETKKMITEEWLNDGGDEPS